MGDILEIVDDWPQGAETTHHKFQGASDSMKTHHENQGVSEKIKNLKQGTNYNMNSQGATNKDDYLNNTDPFEQPTNDQTLEGGNLSLEDDEVKRPADNDCDKSVTSEN